MSTPLSLKYSPLTDYGDQTYKTLLHDDYAAEKLTIKAKGTTKTNAVINFKASTSAFDPYDGKKAQEVKIQFPFNKQYIWFGTNNEGAKIHVDFGEYEFVKKQNFFFNAKLFSSKGYSLRFGSVYNGPSCQSISSKEFEISYNLGIQYNEQNKQSFILNRTLIKRKDFQCVLVNEFNPMAKEWTKYNFLAGLYKKDFDLTLRHQSVDSPQCKECKQKNILKGLNCSKCKIGLGKVILDFVYKKKEHTLGAEFAMEGKNAISLLLGVSTKYKDALLKTKVDPIKKHLHVSAKGKINNTFGYIFATQLLGANAKNKYLPVPVGFTLETTV